MQLCHIDLLSEMLIEKGVVSIKLVKTPLAMECNVEHSMDGDGIYHGIESLMKINTQLLVKAFSKKSSFILSNRAIGILFDVKKTHLLPTMFCLGLGAKRDQVLFRMRPSYSSCMA